MHLESSLRPINSTVQGFFSSHTLQKLDPTLQPEPQSAQTTCSIFRQLSFVFLMTRKWVPIQDPFDARNPGPSTLTPDWMIKGAP